MSLIDELTALLDKARAQDDEIAHLHEQLNEHDEQLVDLRQLLSARDDQLASLREQLAAQDERIIAQDRLIGLVDLVVKQMAAYRARYETTALSEPEVTTGATEGATPQEAQERNAHTLADTVHVATIQVEDAPESKPRAPRRRGDVTPDELRTWVNDLNEGINPAVIAKRRGRNYWAVKNALVEGGYMCKDCNKPLTPEMGGVCSICRERKSQHMENPAFLQTAH
jgi:uncharacterized protein (DUF3084 family)